MIGVAIFVIMIAALHFLMVKRYRASHIEWERRVALPDFFRGILGAGRPHAMKIGNCMPLILRMQAYARLLGGDQVNPLDDAENPESRKNSLLGPDGYKVLLGTIKKVEAKATSVAAIVVFFAVIFVTVLPVVRETHWAFNAALGCIGFLVYLGGILVGGFHQIDQVITNIHLKNGKEGDCLDLAMEADLMADLLRKEAEYDACCWMLAPPLIVLVLILASALKF